MNSIKYRDYKNDGQIIDLEESKVFNQKHLPGSINIPYETLMFHYKDYLDQNKKYYLYCSGGRKSKRAVLILQYYGYDVIQITK